MSSAPDSIAAGSTLQHYRLVERLGDAAHTWLAEDTRNGSKVAVKILSRTIPKDKASRDAALKQIRLKAAIGHPGIATIIMIDIEGDVLWMASEFVEGDSLTRYAQREKASKRAFLRYAIQMADILAAVHADGVVLGKMTGESWIITADDDVKLVGFQLASFMGNQETGQTLISGIKSTHLREAAYLSPEQVTGKLVTSKTDVFALGVCLYELIAGALPFQGASVADVAHAVNTASPPAPTNPNIDRSFLGPIGKCIQKNPNNRFEKVSLLRDELKKLVPDVDTIARRRGATSPGGIPVPKREAASATETFIVVGELPYHELLRSKDPARASRLENAMQQYLGEAVYLFDGKVLDSLGPVMVASMDDGESAIKAAQKGLADLVAHNIEHGGEPVEARMLVHFGELAPTAGKPEGSGLTIAMTVLDAMEPLQLLVSKPVINRVDVDGTPASIGRLADIDLFHPPKLREPAPPLPPDGAEAATAPTAESATTPEAMAPPPPPKAAGKRKGTPVFAIGIAAVAVLILGGIAAVFALKNRDVPEAAPAAPVAAPRPATPAPVVVEIDPNKIFFAPFELEESVQDAPVEAVAVATETSGIDASPASDDTEATAAPEIPAAAIDQELREASHKIRAAIDRLTALDPTLERVIAPGEDSRTVGGRLARGETGIILTPHLLIGETETPGDPIPVDDVDLAAVAYLRQVWPTLERALTFIPSNDVAVASYLEARALAESGDLDNALEAVRLVTGTEPDFVTGLQLQMDILLAQDNQDEAINTAKRIAVLDREDAAIRQRLADWEFERANPGDGIVWLGQVLALEPENVDVLTRIGQYTLAIGNEAKFNAVLRRLQTSAIENPRLSPGDIVLARGRLDAAAKKYYEDLNTQPDNPILSLKIARLAVLRRSEAVLEAEHDRLRRLGAKYELTLLQAYIDANDGNAEAAEAGVTLAAELASPLDPIYTASAEVFLLLDRQAQVLESLKNAVERAEPTHEYILSNPVFGYLSSDPRFRELLQTLGEQRTRIRAGLDTIDF